MIWVAGMVLAFIFVKLGSLLILVKLLAIGLGVAVIANILLAVTLFWRKAIFRKST